MNVGAILVQYHRHRLIHHELLVHRIKESLVIVGGLFVNQNVLLVWKKSQKILKQIPVTTRKQSKIRMPYSGKRQ